MKSATARKPLTPAQFRNFIFAGRAVFTLENKDTGNYLTFKIKQIRKAGKLLPGQFGVQCKALNDDTHGYQFMGFMNTEIQEFRPYRRTASTFIGFKTFYWLLDKMNRLEEPKFASLAIYHEGVCCKCSLPLTVPESIEDGIGPICKQGMLKKSIEIMVELGTYDPMQDYSANVRLALAKDPQMWNKLHIPTDVSESHKFVVHKMFSRLKIW